MQKRVFCFKNLFFLERQIWDSRCIYTYIYVYIISSVLCYLNLLCQTSPGPHLKGPLHKAGGWWCRQWFTKEGIPWRQLFSPAHHWLHHRKHSKVRFCFLIFKVSSALHLSNEQASTNPRQLQCGWGALFAKLLEAIFQPTCLYERRLRRFKGNCKYYV